ncbi:MAG: hypothetical protein OXB86_00860 [Bdellovibrionales bacterium]|nr:hypothetical protein [Bdellovibrionales bacterium]
MGWHRFFLLLCLLYPLAGEAAKVRFSKEELAKESVLPVFDPMHLVLGRNITLSKRLEGGVSLSFGPDEPFYFPFYATGLLAFYMTETHGVSLTGTWFPPRDKLLGWEWKNEKGEKKHFGIRWPGLDLKEPTQPSVEPIDVWKVPYPQMMGFLNYQYTPFYGKISIAKTIVTNLSIYGFAGPGIIMFNEGTVTPAGNIGLGLKIYFNRWLALRGGLRFYGYYGPSPAKVPLSSQTSPLSYSSIPSVQKGVIIHLVCSVGFVFLI